MYYKPEGVNSSVICSRETSVRRDGVNIFELEKVSLKITVFSKASPYKCQKRMFLVEILAWSSYQNNIYTITTYYNISLE